MACPLPRSLPLLFHLSLASQVVLHKLLLKFGSSCLFGPDKLLLRFGLSCPFDPDKLLLRSGPFCLSALHRRPFGSGLSCLDRLPLTSSLGSLQHPSDVLSDVPL